MVAAPWQRDWAAAGESMAHVVDRTRYLNFVTAERVVLGDETPKQAV
jgi:hypothetical protein